MSKAADIRTNAIAWAKRMTADPWNLFLDTETTGLNDSAEICDIAVINLRGEILLDTLVKPRNPIPADATAIHGIGDDHVADARPWSEVCYHLSSILGSGRPVIIYNQAFDQKIINQCCERAQIPTFPLGPRWHCAMRAFADFDGTIGKFNSPKWWKLPEACARLEIESVETHRALADAGACRSIVLAMARAS